MLPQATKNGGRNGCQTFSYSKLFQNDFVICDVCCSLSEESALEKLQRLAKEVEAQKIYRVKKLEKKHYTTEAFAKQIKFQAGLEKQVSEPIYNIVLLIMISPLASPSSSKCEKGKRFMQEIGEVIRCADDIKEMTRPMLERLQKGFFKGQVMMEHRTIPQELVEIPKSNDENKEKGVGVI